jgi:hypothetical protein
VKYIRHSGQFSSIGTAEQIDETEEIDQCSEGLRSVSFRPRHIPRTPTKHGDADVAMGTKWHLLIGFPPKHKNLSNSNLSFEESFLVTQIAFQRKLLDFTLDTGATHTVLSPRLLKSFPFF